MTSREHARRLMLILLSSPGRPGAGEPAGGREEREDRVTRDRGEDVADAEDRRGPVMVEAVTWS
ncbi:MAG: hypothetical protein QOD81_1103 [Solirubrobacteraceae bacterium]|jgi:hypothetical protein|nr:hypothetical protein [Solirubrobacteraceae bacterium]